MKSKTQKPAILIIDDDEQIRTLLVRLLCDDYECTDAASAEEALAVLDKNVFDLIVSDITMGGISGLDLVPLVHRDAPDTVVVMVSGQQTIETAIEAMRAGAFDYITKPFDSRHVQAAMRRALDHHRLLTEKRRHESRLEDLVRERTAEVKYLAYYDRLTNLPNRVLFADRCAQALAIAQHNQQIVAIILVSLDQFKKVSDTLGHAAGDILLGEAAARLQSCVMKGDTVARFDGDEFALLLTRLHETGDSGEIALAINEALKPSFQMAEQEVYVTASIGISVFPSNGDDSETMLKNAGAALNRAKQAGGNNYQFYNADMNARASKRLTLETSLRQAIENEEFITYYQPSISFASGEVVGLEALVRWQHPKLGVLAPAEFIGLAEDTGLIFDIGDFVMRTACAQTRAWQDAGFADLRIAVNVSARQFQQKGLVEKVARILSEARLDPRHLELEITETSLMKNPEAAARLLTEIRETGVKIAIDDFGTGYSALSYLKHLPIDTLKLDRSFVVGVATHSDDAALVMAIITLAHNLGLRVVAEGVETEEQLVFLRLLRCDEGQGYLFSRPVPPDQIESLIAERANGRGALALTRKKRNGDADALVIDPENELAEVLA